MRDFWSRRKAAVEAEARAEQVARLAPLEEAEDEADCVGLGSTFGSSSPPHPERVPARARAVTAMRMRFMSVLPEPESPDALASGTSPDEMADSLPTSPYCDSGSR